MRNKAYVNLVVSQILKPINSLKINYGVQAKKMYLVNECYKMLMYSVKEERMFNQVFIHLQNVK